MLENLNILRYIQESDFLRLRKGNAANFVNDLKINLFPEC